MFNIFMLKRVFDFVKFYLHLHEDAKISLLKLPLLSLHTKTRGQKTTTFSFFERTRPSKSILEIVLLFFFTLDDNRARKRGLFSTFVLETVDLFGRTCRQ
jgi:hypothetical protein